MSVRYLNSTKKRLGDYLVELGFITEQQLDSALREQKEKGGKLGTILIQLGILSEDVLLAILGKQSGVGYVSLTEFGDIAPEAIKAVPGAIARNQLMIPIKKEGNLLTVAIADPLNVFATDDLKALTGCDIKMVVAGESEIKTALEKYYAASKSEAAPARREAPAPQAAPAAADDPAVSLTNSILLDAVKLGASDVHIEPLGDSLVVRFRLDGVLKVHVTPPREMHSALVSRLKVLANMDISERRIPQDGRAKIQVEGRDIDVRLSTVPTAYGERAVIRLMDKRELRPTLEKLGMEEGDLTTFRRLLERRRGLVIVAGQLAAGKTTTLYCAATTAGTPAVSVLTVEDPIRHLVPGISQVQAKDDIGLSTANAIRAFVRQEADVIMVGELTDADATQASAHAALEGRLVLAGLFAPDAAAAIVRLVDLGVEPSMLASALKLVIAQHMLRRVCEACRVQDDVFGADLQGLGANVAAARRYKISRAVGCDACHGTGYSGRIGAFEMVEMNDDLHRLIVHRASVADYHAAIRRAGTESLRKAALKLALSGLTTLDEVVRVTDADDAQRDRQ